MTTLRKQEPAGLELKRIACEQVESAIRFLTRQAGQGLLAAKAINQTHAVLALVEVDLPKAITRRDRAILARLSVGLAELTEPIALAEQLDTQYKKSPPDAAIASAVKNLRKRWSAADRSGSALSPKAGTFNPVIYRLVADMAELRGHFGDWPVDSISSEAPPRGLRRSYTKARKLADTPATAESIDALQSAVGQLGYQLTLISKSCPAMVKAQRKLITRCADALAVISIDEKLDSALREELGKAASKAMPDREPMDKRVSQAIESDLSAALAETPSAFMNRMQVYWSAWRGV